MKQWLLAIPADTADKLVIAGSAASAELATPIQLGMEFWGACQGVGFQRGLSQQLSCEQWTWKQEAASLSTLESKLQSHVLVGLTALTTVSTGSSHRIPATESLCSRGFICDERFVFMASGSSSLLPVAPGHQAGHGASEKKPGSRTQALFPKLPVGRCHSQNRKEADRKKGKFPVAGTSATKSRGMRQSMEEFTTMGNVSIVGSQMPDPF